MNDFFNEMLKREKELQKLVSPFYDPSINRLITQVNTMFEKYPEILNLEDHTMLDDSLTSSMIKKIHSISSSIDRLNVISHWQSVFNALIDTKTLNPNDMIPDSLYRSLVDLTVEIENETRFQTGFSNMPFDITVESPSSNQNDPTKTPMNWGNFITIVIAILALMLQFQDSELSSKQHEEKMAEERKQTRIMEQQNKIDKQILIELQSQSKAQNEIIKSNQIINDKLEQLLDESIKSVTVDQPDQGASESD